MKKSTILIQPAIVIAIIIVGNLISRKIYFRLDFTEDKRYTLSNATRDVLANLNEVITIQAYFTEELPPQLTYARNDLRDMLLEYEDLSNGDIVFEFINPNESEEKKQEAMQSGVAPIRINVIENDQRKQMDAFLGVVMKSGDRTEVIPLVQPEGAMEFDLTTTIKKISVADKPKLGLMNGYGEPTLSAFPQLLQQLSVLYDVETFNIADTATVPAYYRGLVWVNPTDTIAPVEFRKLDQYLNNGGTVFLAYSSVRGDLQQLSLNENTDVGITGWVAGKGLTYEGEFVVDASCVPVTVQQRQGFFTINSQVNFHYFPKISEFEDHPVTKGLENVLFTFSNAFTINNPDSSVSITPILFTSEQSGAQPAPGYINIQKQWSAYDFPLKKQILGTSIEGIGAGNGRMIVVGNGQFLVNGEGQQAQQLNPDNVNLAGNAIDWLTDDTGLIDLRTKGITARPLDKVEDSTKNLLKYGNVFAPMLLILIYAFVRKQHNNRKRLRRAQGNYS